MSEIRLSRRKMVGCAAATALGIGLAAGLGQASRPTLHVFFPALERVRTVQSRLEQALPGVEITVFGRYVDFASGVKGQPPDAALAPGATLTSASIPAALLGYKNGSHDERYVVLEHTLSKNPRMGVVDVVGRTALPSFVSRAFGSTSVRPLQRVLKVADLLQLLQLDLAGSVFVPESYAPILRERSRLTLQVKPLREPLPTRAALAFPADSRRVALESALRHLPRQVTEIFRTEEWR